MLKKSGLYILSLATAAAVAGCRVGGGVTNQASQNAPTSSIMAPIIAIPAVSPYYSGASSVVISGACMAGNMVYLNGSTNDQAPCAGNSFSFTVAQAVDGVYSFAITQGAPGAALSTPANFVWIRKSTVSPPNLTYPATSPFLSGLPTLTLTGSCETGTQIALSGDGAGSTVCTNSIFSLTLPKAVDGDYNLILTQTDSAGNTASRTLVWKKYALTFSLGNPSLVVGTSRTVTVAGGSGSYNISLTTNNSGAPPFNSTTRLYTAGHLANVNDVLTVTDTLGQSGTMTVTTQADVPDHFILPSGSGSGQTTLVGQAMGAAVKVQLVDQFNNGVGAGVPIVFRPLIGDATITSAPMVVTDASGFASATVRMGYKAVLNGIVAGPLTGSFPDAALTGNGTIVVAETSSALNKGKLNSTFATGVNPGAFVVADFNGDGIPDVAVVNGGELSVGIFLGQGNGMLKPMVKINGVCSNPNAIAAGDFNGDGKPDLVVLCEFANKWAVLINKGDGTGTFNAPVVHNDESLPGAVVVGDFDKDGKIDIAITSVGNHTVDIHYGDGSGTFGPAGIYQYDTTQTGPTSIAIIDFNATNYADFVVANSNNGSLSILTNNHNRTFTVRPPIALGLNPGAIVAGDMNYDGYGDVAAVGDDGNIHIYLNDHAGNLVEDSVLTTIDTPTSLAWADFDGDGLNDLVVTNAGTGNIQFYIGAMNGSFTPSTIVTTDPGPVFVAAADMDNDGYIDALITSSSTQVVQIIPSNKGTMKFGYTGSIPSTPVASAVADFTGDGIMDIAVLNGNAVTIFKGRRIIPTTKTSGFFDVLPGSLSVAMNSTAIVAADFNNDGKIDIAVTQPASVIVFLGNGDGTFGAGVPYSVGNTPNAIAVADFDHDGYLDIAVTNGGSNTVSVLPNKKDGTFGVQRVFAVGQTPTGIAIADFDNDRNFDIAVASGIDHQVDILWGNGDLTFQAFRGYDVTDAPVALVALDYNADGKMDIAVVDSGTTNISLMKGNGDKTFTVQGTTYASGGTPQMISVGDFDGDGAVDLIIANGTTNQISVLFNRSGTFNTSTSFATGFNVPAFAVSDFNKDGSLDVLLLDATNKMIQTWMGH